MTPARSLILGVLACGLSGCAQPGKSDIVTSSPVTPHYTAASLAAQANNGSDKAAMVLAAANIRAGNMAAAFHWFKLAADRGSADGEAGLGMFYAHGLGVPQDYRQALKYDRMSAEQNNAAGLNNLAVVYEHGWGVPADPIHAAELYRRAAMLGNNVAQAAIARCREQGVGVAKDPRLAYFWYSLAAAKLRGAMLARTMARRDALAGELPAETVATLQSAAAVWQPGTEPPASSARVRAHPAAPGQLRFGPDHTSL